MKRLALLTTLAALAMPAAAHAYNPADLHRWEAVADQVWGGACAGRLQADVVPQLPEPDGAPANFVTLGRAHINDAVACIFQIVDGLDPYVACVVTVHEAGHLAGFGHTSGGIMDPSPADALEDHGYAPCAHAVPPVLTKSAALNWFESQWVFWTSDCRRDRIVSRMRCWGRTVLGTRVVAVVWRDGDHRLHGARLGRRS